MLFELDDFERKTVLRQTGILPTHIPRILRETWVFLANLF